MKTLGFTYWQDGAQWLGYLEEFPDYWTQGESEAELGANLLDLYKEFSSGLIPAVSRREEIREALRADREAQ